MNQYRPWSEEEDALLKRLRQTCLSLSDIAPHFPRRSPGAIGCRLQKLGISYPNGGKSTWDGERADRLRYLWDVEGKSASECAKILGVSRNAVIGRAHRMELTKRASPIKHRNVVEVYFGGCEWPEGEKPYTFCGEKRQHGSSYCPEHHARAWYKPARKKNPAAHKLFGRVIG